MGLITEEQEFRPHFPIVCGSLDYRRFEQRLRRMEELLGTSGLEDRFVEGRVRAWVQGAGREPSAREQLRIQRQSRRALRCTLARQWTEKEYRRFARRLAESSLLQRFCLLDRIDVVRVPSKSALQRYEAMADEEEIRRMAGELNRLASSMPEGGRQPLGLAEAAGAEMVWADSTCLKANIHFPVDWVLLRDAVRTLMKAVILIRRQGLKHRMEEPAEFMKRMNRLSMQMTQAGRRSGSVRSRKKILRSMKRLTGIVRRHAERYRRVLSVDWRQTEWTQRQAEQVLSRIDGVLAVLPSAIRQAHERIIGRRIVPNEAKVLSLYEPELRVIVRGKAGAEVEFGNTLYLAEQRHGLIVDWKLLREGAPGDAKLLEESLERMQEIFGSYPLGVGADRGFDRRKTREYLAEREIYNGLCPKSPKDLRHRLQDEVFADVQRRRAQTEGRIGILQNDFFGHPLRNKGFESRERAVAWAVLGHNLWVLARLPQAEETKRRKRAA